MDFYKKYRFIIWSVLAIIVLAIIAWIIYLFTVFQVLSISPAQGSKISGGSSQITFTFNKEIDKIDLNKQLYSTEGLAISSQIDKNKLTLFVSNINQTKQYQIQLSNIRSKEGSLIKFVSYKFQGAFVPYSQLSNTEKNKQIKETDSGNYQDPAMNILPIYGDNFAIEYTLLPTTDSKGKNIKLNITLLLDKFNIEDKATISLYKKQAIDFLKQNGINPNDYQIEWTPSEAANL